MHPVRARVAQIHGFSAHADKGELFRWLSGLKKSPRHLFVTHGEPDAAQSFAKFLREKKNWDISIPKYQDEVVLD
jgi:metallo-beta-lactamase family protein